MVDDDATAIFNYWKTYLSGKFKPGGFAPAHVHAIPKGNLKKKIKATVVQDQVTVYNVHAPEKCLLNASCIVHAPSDHHMRSWPLVWRGDKGVFERTCPHDIGHPDPDDIAYHISQGKGALGVHGCDGCCNVR